MGVRAFSCRVIAAGLLGIGLGRAAVAQPGQPEPPEFVDLGALGYGDSADSGDQVLTAGGHVWFRFELVDPITPELGWVDLDTYGPNVIVNNDMALYDNNKIRIARDNDSAGSGAGPNSPNYAAAMSFGSGSGRRLTLDPLGGVLSDGLKGDNLEPGIYWVCLGAFNTTFPEFNNNWDTTTGSVDSGFVRLKISVGQKPDSYWNERHLVGDAGILPSTAAPVVGHGALETIMTSFSSGSRAVDAFRIRITNPAQFSAIAEASTYTETNDGQGGGSYGSRLYLFDTDGFGLAAVRGVNGSVSTLLPSEVVSIPPGEYCLIITSNCAGTNSMLPYPMNDSGEIFNFTSIGTETIAPNGPGASEPVDSWGAIGSCNGGDVYVVKISLTGAGYLGGGATADINGDGVIDFGDIQAFIALFLSGG